MARFSVAEAATAGLGVIGRKPLAVLAWGLVIFVATAAPMYLLLCAMRPDFAMLMQMGQPPGSASDPQMVGRLLRMQSGMMLFQLLFWLWATGVKAVICSAVFRAVLEPQDSRFAYLRLGAREGWLTLLFLVEYVLAYIACFVLALLGVVVVAIVAMGGGAQANLAAIWTAAALGLAALALFLWLALRLSMAAPMTFADRQFRLFESWSFTRGRLGRLLGVALLLTVLLIGIEVLFGGLMLGGIFTLGGGISWVLEPGALEALVREPPMEIVRRLGPAIGVAGVLLVVFSTVVTTVFCAPWAASYQALLNEGPAQT